MTSYSIFVRSQVTYVIEVTPTTTIRELKQKIYEKSQIDPSKQRLHFCGKLLNEAERTLAEYNVQRDCTVHIEVEMEGGE